MNYESLREVLFASYAPPHLGKVRDSYSMPNGQRKRRLSVVSDRASVFDFPLGFDIPGKGEALNAFNIAARRFLEQALPGIKQDIVAYGVGIDSHLPRSLQGNRDLWKRATIVEERAMILKECVVRGDLTGGGYRKYVETGAVCGHVLPVGLPDGAPLDPPLFTPTTKAKIGHDEFLDYRKVRQEHGIELEEYSISVFRVLASHSRRRGVLGADTKLEWARGLTLADEVWTPDSSRFWEAAAYERSYPNKIPEAMDKEILRDWGRSVGLDKLDPKNPEDRQRALAFLAPPEVIEGMMARIHQLFEMLWGQSITQFQKQVLGVDD